MNQPRIHQRLQVVLKNHAQDLDLLDRVPTKPPANPAGNLQLSTSTESAGQDACEPHASLRALGLTKRARGASLAFGLAEFVPAQQKEYQCQES